MTTSGEQVWRDDRFRFLGAMIGDREHQQSWSAPHPELPLVFISLGSIFTDHPAAPWFRSSRCYGRPARSSPNGGMNSTMEALYYGVPMLSFPQMPEQAVNADRVAVLGLGQPLVEGLTSSPGIRANLDRMQAEVRSAGGVDAGAHAIEEYLA